MKHAVALLVRHTDPLLGRRSTAVAASSLVLCAALAVSGCEAEATCGAAPTVPIVGFIVTTTTGDDGTDGDISFCISRRSTGDEECELLDELFADDFEPYEVNTFEWTLDIPIAPGDLEGFLIRNDGGSFFGNNNWELVGLRVEARVTDGSTVLLYEVEMSEDLDTGDSYDSSQCTY